LPFILLGNFASCNDQLKVTAGAASVRLGHMILKSLSIVGSDSCTASELRAVFEFMERKGIRPNIFKTFSLDDVISAHKLLQDRNAQGRTVLKISDVWN